MATVQLSQPDMAMLEWEILNTLNLIFDAFERENAAYCVLRNRHYIPSRLTKGSDVDVVVSRNISSRKLWRLLEHLGPVQVIEHRSASLFYFPVDGIYLRVDVINGDQEWLGARVLENRELLENTWNDRGIPVASELHQACAAWIMNLLWSGTFKEQYRDLILAAWQDKSDEFDHLLVRAFGPRVAASLAQCVAHDQLEQSPSLARVSRKALWTKSFRDRPDPTLAGAIDYVSKRVRLRMQPAGLSVAILGPDGSGKSTICERLSHATTAELPFNRVTYHHLYRSSLPRLAELRHRGRRRGPKNVTYLNATEPHGKPIHGPVLSVVRMLYMALDQWLSEAKWGNQELARNHLRLHDRHLLEISVDPARYRYGGPAWFARLFAQSVPQPDIVILLDAPARILQERKQEVPADESMRQRQRYLSLVEGMPNGHVVDASQSLDRVLADVKEIIVGTLAARTRQRYGRRYR